MGLAWPQISSNGGDLNQGSQDEIRIMLDALADRTAAHLTALGLPSHASPMFRPFSLVVIQDAEKVLVAFTVLAGGIASLRWIDQSSQLFPASQLPQAIQDQLGQTVTAAFVLPLPGTKEWESSIEAAAANHATEVERSQRLGRLGDLTGLSHLEPHLRDFLNDHPDPKRNVFVMMRFHPSEQLDEAHAAIRDTLKARGFHAMRADDRDYTGELWSNIEVYLTGCQYGIAVFEDIDKRDFNPNVSLELGYMMGRRKRCLILKEKRLPDLPADVIHRLYKPWDMFNVTSSVSLEVARWVDVDLGFSGAA